MDAKKLRTLIDAYARAFDAHEDACLELGAATVLHDGPRKSRMASHRDELEASRARYRETSRAVRDARGAILAALESAIAPL